MNFLANIKARGLASKHAPQMVNSEFVSHRHAARLYPDRGYSHAGCRLGSLKTLIPEEWQLPVLASPIPLSTLHQHLD
jgi:hypothetical protein